MCAFFVSICPSRRRHRHRSRLLRNNTATNPWRKRWQLKICPLRPTPFRELFNASVVDPPSVPCHGDRLTVTPVGERRGKPRPRLGKGQITNKINGKHPKLNNEVFILIPGQSQFWLPMQSFIYSLAKVSILFPQYSRRGRSGNSPPLHFSSRGMSEWVSSGGSEAAAAVAAGHKLGARPLLRPY